MAKPIMKKYRNVLVRTPAGSVILEESDTSPDKLERQVNEVLGSPLPNTYTSMHNGITYKISNLENQEYLAAEALERGFAEVFNCPRIVDTIGLEHVRETPKRYRRMLFDELFWGCFQDPEAVLRKSFSEKKYDEMIFINEISFVSLCAHHLVPFTGVCHFAYVPDKKIVGLSKVARLVEIYARRPQVQEKLTEEIADTFVKVVKPKGCGVVMEAMHLCMAIRGVKKAAVTKTQVLRGVFLQPLPREEFLRGVPQRNGGGRIWL
jgi:GTP cyclohydrolase I